jgi:hypothetical protein
MRLVVFSEFLEFTFKRLTSVFEICLLMYNC